MFRVMLAGLRMRKGRLLLSGLSITLGVAFVAGTLMLNDSLRQQFSSSFAVAAQGVDAVVASPESGDPPGQQGGRMMPFGVLAAVRSTPGVAAAGGRLIGPATLLDGAGRPIGSGLGVSVTTGDPSLTGFRLVRGSLPSAPDQVAVDQATVTDSHFLVGQGVRVVTATGAVRTFTLTGVIDPGVNPQFGDSSVSAFVPATAIKVTGAHGWNLVVARAAPGVSQADLAARLSARTPGQSVLTGARFATAEEDSAVKMAASLATILGIFAAIALLVACLVVYNTFGILIAQRSRELALQRCVGATRRQVFVSTLGESAVTGLVASLLGVLGGAGVGWLLTRVFSAGSPAPLVVSGVSVVIPVAVGLIVTMTAAVLPARSATRVAPVSALSAAALDTVSASAGKVRVLSAVLTAVLGVLLTVAGCNAHSLQSGFISVAAGGCLVFLALLLLGPLLVPRAISLLGAGLTGPVMRLARTNAQRNPHRVAAATAALAIGVTLMSLFSVVFTSIRATSDAAVQGHFAFDYVVRSHGGEPVPASVVRSLSGSASLSVVAGSYSGPPTSVNGKMTGVGAYDSSALGTAVRPAMRSGSLTSVGPGRAAVTAEAGLGVGSVISVRTPSAGVERLRVVAVYDVHTYSSPLPPVLLSVHDYLRGFTPGGPDQVVIDAARGVDPSVSRAAVTSVIARDPLLSVLTLADYKASLDHGINQVLEIISALLGLAVLIALFGISSMLSLSVLERTRESALLRALGLTRGQLRRMLHTESMLMGLLSAVIGIGLGVAYGLALMQTISHSTGRAGFAVFAVPYGQLALFCAVAIGAAVLAAVLPARRASRAAPVSATAEA